MVTFEPVATGVIASESFGGEWIRDLLETRDDLILWAHENNVDMSAQEADELFKVKEYKQ